MSSPVRIQSDGVVTTLAIVRPDRGNALDAECWREIRQGSIQLTDKPPRALIVTGSSECFSVGLDMALDNPVVGRIEQLSKGGDIYGLQELLRRLQNAITSISRIPCPVIAAIEGACHGVGAELAMACDLRVASREVDIRFGHTQQGLVPSNGGLVALSRQLGHARTAELVLTGRSLGAEEALALGLVTRISEPGEALSEARALAERIASASQEATKQALLALRKLAGPSEDYEAETDAAARAIGSGDFMAAVAAAMTR